MNRQTALHRVAIKVCELTTAEKTAFVSCNLKEEGNVRWWYWLHNSVSDSRGKNAAIPFCSPFIPIVVAFGLCEKNKTLSPVRKIHNGMLQNSKTKSDIFWPSSSKNSQKRSFRELKCTFEAFGFLIVWLVSISCRICRTVSCVFRLP